MSFVKTWDPFITVAEAAIIARRTKGWVRDQAVCGRVDSRSDERGRRLVSRNDICRLVLLRSSLTDDERFAALEEMITSDRTDDEQYEYDSLSLRSTGMPTGTSELDGLQSALERQRDAGILSETFGPVENYVDIKDVKVAIADEAKNIVAGARRAAYGKPEQNFERIARFWQAYFENTGRGAVKITAQDVSPLMRLMKEARLAETPDHRDSFVDIVGYALTGAEVAGVKA